MRHVALLAGMRQVASLVGIWQVAFIGWQVWQWRLNSHITFGKGGMRHVAFLAGRAGRGGQAARLFWLDWHAAGGWHAA